jgi:hypothetical protein
MVTWAEASLCSKCSNKGDEGAVQRSVDTNGVGLKIVTLYCRNPLCVWVDSPWYVSVYPDGSIMQPQGGREKQFDMPEGGRLAIAKRMEDVDKYAGEDLTQPGLEIRKR